MVNLTSCDGDMIHDKNNGFSVLLFAFYFLINKIMLSDYNYKF